MAYSENDKYNSIDEDDPELDEIGSELPVLYEDEEEEELQAASCSFLEYLCL